MRRITRARRPSDALLLASTLGLSGCASFSPDSGMTVVVRRREPDHQERRRLRAHGRRRRGRRAAGAQRLLSRPLTVDAAVQVALLNNKGLQAAYNELALAETELVAAEPAAQSDILDLRASPAMAPARSNARSSATSSRWRPCRSAPTSRATVSGRRSSRRRWRRCGSPPTSGAPISVRSPPTRCVALLTDAKSTAEATAQLATKLGETGAINKLDQAREQVFYAETTADLATARQDATSARERLARLMGLWGDDLGFRLPDQLAAAAAPSIGAARRSRPTRSAIASTCRSRGMELAALAKSLNLTEATRFVTLLDVAGIDRRTQRSGSAAIPRARLRRPVPDPDLRRRRGARAAGGRDLQRGLQPPDRKGRQRALGGARCLPRLPLDLRHRQPLPARGPAAAQDHHRGDAAALLQHAGRRVRPADRGAAAHRLAARARSTPSAHSSWRSPTCRAPSMAAERATRAATAQSHGRGRRAADGGH